MKRISFNSAIWHHSLFNNTYHASYIRNCSVFLVLFVSRFSSSFTPSPSWIALTCSDQHLGLLYEIHISRKRPTFSFWWVHLRLFILLDIFGHNWMFTYVNIAKGTTDPRVEFISQVLTHILIKFHLKNLDQASTSKSEPNQTRISTKNELHSHNQASLVSYWQA